MGLGSEQQLQHHGDWEHVCVLVSLDDLGNRDAPPVGIHFHAHVGLEVADEASTWHADAFGEFHPHVSPSAAYGLGYEPRRVLNVL